MENTIEVFQSLKKGDRIKIKSILNQAQKIASTLNAKGYFLPVNEDFSIFLFPGISLEFSDTKGPGVWSGHFVFNVVGLSENISIYLDKNDIEICEIEKL